MAEKKIPEKKPEEKPKAKPKKLADEATDDILKEFEEKPTEEKPTREKKETTPLSVLSKDLAGLNVPASESGSLSAKEGEEVEEKPEKEAKPEVEDFEKVVEPLTVEYINTQIGEITTAYQTWKGDKNKTVEDWEGLYDRIETLGEAAEEVMTDDQDKDLTELDELVGIQVNKYKADKLEAEEEEDRARIKKLEDAINGEKLKTHSYVADDVGNLIFFKDGKLFYETATGPKEITPVFKGDGKTMDYFTVNGYKLEPKDAAAANTLAGYLKAQATDRKKIKKTAEIPAEEPTIDYGTDWYGKYRPLRKATGEEGQKLLAENLIHLYQFKKTASEAAYTAATDAFAKAIKKNEDLQNLSDEQLEDILTTEGAHWIDRPAIMRVYDNVQEAETPEKPTKLSEEE